MAQGFNIRQAENPRLGYTMAFGLFLFGNCFVSFMYKSVLTSQMMAPKAIKVINTIDDLRRHSDVAIMVTEGQHLHEYLTALAEPLPNPLYLVPFDKLIERSEEMAMLLQAGRLDTFLFRVQIDTFIFFRIACFLRTLGKLD